MSSYRVVRVNIWRQGDGGVMRAVPEGHRLHPGDGPRDVYERYREVPGGLEMRRSRDRRRYGPPLADPLAYLPDRDGLTLLEAVRAHHRMQMRHAQTGHGSSALNLYRPADILRERKHRPGETVARDGAMHLVLVIAPRTAALNREPEERSLADDHIAWLFADDRFVGQLPMEFVVCLDLEDHDNIDAGSWEMDHWGLKEPSAGMHRGNWGGGFYIEAVHRPDRPHPEVTFIEDYCIDPADGDGNALVRTLWQFMGEPAPDGPDALWRNPAYPHHDLDLPWNSRRRDAGTTSRRVTESPSRRVETGTGDATPQPGAVQRGAQE